MPIIQIPFPKSPSSVSVTRGPAPAASSPGHANHTQGSSTDSAPDPDHQEAALKTLATIDTKMKAIRQAALAEIESFRSHLHLAASQIAKAVVGSDDALIEKQVTHFAETLIHELRPDH